MKGIYEGYDLRQDAPVPFAEVADTIRKSIVGDYGLSEADLLPYKGDALKWGSYKGDGNLAPGPSAFASKYR